MKILTVVAHPDDEVLGCGGTLCRLSKEGNEIYIAILGEGITSRYKQREQADKTLVSELQNRSKKAAKLIGAKDIFFYSLPDNRFDTIPLLDIVKIIEEIVEHLKPQIIYTHNGGDLNIDHSIVNRAVITATRPKDSCPVEEIYTFEVPSSTEWTFGYLTPTFRPNVFFNIKDTLNLKIEALKIYESEIKNFPHPRSAEFLTALARYRGGMVGLEAAEAFELIRKIA